jgi:hypothetical protein
MAHHSVLGETVAKYGNELNLGVSEESKPTRPCGCFGERRASEPGFFRMDQNATGKLLYYSMRNAGALLRESRRRSRLHLKPDFLDHA